MTLSFGIKYNLCKYRPDNLKVLHWKLNIKLLYRSQTDKHLAPQVKSRTCFLEVPPPFFLLSAVSAAEGSVPEPSHPE